MISNELTCKQFVGLLTQYLEQTLLPEIEALLERHLQHCPGCALYLEQIQTTVRVLRAQAMEPMEPMEPERRRAILQAFRKRQRG